MKAVLLSLLLCGLAACGFQPAYAPTEGRALAGGLIEIEPIPGRAGYMLRRSLEQELSAGLPGLAEPVVLSVDLRDQLSRLSILADGAASRSTLVATGRYRLQGEAVNVRGSVSVETGFIVPEGPFGDISAQTGAQDRAMRELAKRIADDLRLRLAAG
jgi:LPS-assembly lipoprotein